MGVGLPGQVSSSGPSYLVAPSPEARRLRPNGAGDWALIPACPASGPTSSSCPGGIDSPVCPAPSCPGGGSTEAEIPRSRGGLLGQLQWEAAREAHPLTGSHSNPGGRSHSPFSQKRLRQVKPLYQLLF